MNIIFLTIKELDARNVAASPYDWEKQIKGMDYKNKGL